MPSEETVVFRDFAEEVKAKIGGRSAGELEEQLKSPLEAALKRLQEVLNLRILCEGEHRIKGLGKPDFAISTNGLLVGYIELKAPGKGAVPDLFTDKHDADQWKRFRNLPNILYTDGNEWAVYRGGKQVWNVVRFDGDVARDGRGAVSGEKASDLKRLLHDFLTWRPSLGEKVTAKEVAAMIAPLCKMLREDVLDALRMEIHAFTAIREEWRDLLFPDAEDFKFADCYAQTLTFALLLARAGGADTNDRADAVETLGRSNTLLGKALQVWTEDEAGEAIAASFNMLLRVVSCINPEILSQSCEDDPWLYFYEDFLQEYDPDLRKEAGIYYTPVEVVRAQVRLVDELLRKELGKERGFADRDVITLDPGAGTGTYLLNIVDHCYDLIRRDEGEGSAREALENLACNLYGFEYMVGPYAVAQLRLTKAFATRNIRLPEGPGIYVTDTLESPHHVPKVPPIFYKAISEQHRRALDVKENKRVLVCIGNPPYSRHEAVTPDNLLKTGGWVRWGEFNWDYHQGKKACGILKDFTQPVKDRGDGGHLKNLYNLYVYFWRWALWKVFEHAESEGRGVVSFITASSYLDGPAFAGMRKLLRRRCEKVWIVDLGGDSRGTEKEENIFSIQTPVAVAVAYAGSDNDPESPARVYYARIKGGREEKLASLRAVENFGSFNGKQETPAFEECPSGWYDPFRPSLEGAFSRWPLITDIFPWQHSGVQMKRTWPIAPSEEILKKRWSQLIQSGDRASAFRETGDRKITGMYKPLTTDQDWQKSIAKLDDNDQAPPIVKYAFRSFDRQFIFQDNRLGDRPKPVLWRAHGGKQVYLTSLLTNVVGKGPALTVSADIPDLDHFRGSYGAKHVIPLYRSADCAVVNVSNDLLILLSDRLETAVGAEDLFAYVYGVLAHPAYRERFSEELKGRRVRVPLTKDRELFRQVKEIGGRLLWLHTYGERFESYAGAEAIGSGVRCDRRPQEPGEDYPEEISRDADKQVLWVGKGSFAPVGEEVWEFEVSGMKVLQEWLKRRKRKPVGRRSSPLDDINPTTWPPEYTAELRKLIYILDRTVKGYEHQTELFNEVLDGPLFTADELPPVPEKMRKPPKVI